jgi:hypothetical protein
MKVIELIEGVIQLVSYSVFSSWFFVGTQLALWPCVTKGYAGGTRRIAAKRKEGVSKIRGALFLFYGDVWSVIESK